MCGIAGKFAFGSGKPVERTLIEKMCTTIAHRGPDDQGIYVKDNIGLGMRRLSIIDLQGGHQPIFNEDGTISVVFNGEIYNFQELRKALEERGHRFSTMSDTEVLAHAYEQYGNDFVKRLRGMFAFALYDGNLKKLILARDRMGKKPLHFRVDSGTIWFCSELKAMLTDPAVPREVDRDSLDLYLAFNYVPAPSTIFEGINKLLPGHLLECSKEGVRVERYWDLDNTFLGKGNEEECASELYHLLDEAVKIRLVGEVPLGAFLSGGIDSSIVVGLMAKHSSAAVKTFSIGFSESDFDELHYARIVADRFETDHHEYVVTSNIKEILPNLIKHYDEPVGDSSAIPTYYVSKLTRQSVTVALSGDGGDELFAGYGKYPMIQKIASRLGWNSRIRSLVTGAIIEKDLFGVPVRSVLKRGQDFIGYRLATPEYRNLIWISHFDGCMKSHLYSSTMREYLAKNLARDFYFSRLSKSPNKDPLSRILYMDLTSYLPDDLLTKVDIASMANSLEVRSPFLDSKVVDYCAGIDNSLKLRNGESKYILKKAFANLLPPQILNRTKMGFSIPIDKWLRSDLKGFAYSTFSRNEQAMADFFNFDFIKHMLQSHCSEKVSYGNKLWLLLNFVLWHEEYMGAR